MKYTSLKKFILIVLLLISKFNFSQNKINFGLKIHPNFSFSFVDNHSNLDQKYFSLRQGLYGVNIGICSNLEIKKWLVELSLGLSTSKTGIHFKYYSDFAEINLRSVSVVNEINLGYKIYTSNNPIYDIYVTSSYSYNLIGVQGLSGGNRFVSFVGFEQEIPNIDLNWRSSTLGSGLKIRTQLKKGNKIDYGLSIHFALQKYPEIGFKIKYPTQTFSSSIQPFVSNLNIDFIYYFKKIK